MLPLHSGHSGVESAIVVALAAVVVGAAYALTREGRSRVGALVGVGAVAAASRLAVAAVGGHGATLHLFGHGLELSAVAVVALASYYALFDVRATAVDG
jgi:hypothetical protein